MNKVEKTFLARNQRRIKLREQEEINHELKVTVDSFLAQMVSMKRVDDCRRLITYYEDVWQQKCATMNNSGFVFLVPKKSAFKKRLEVLTEAVISNKNSEYYTEARMLRKALKDSMKERILKLFTSGVNK